MLVPVNAPNAPNAPNQNVQQQLKLPKKAKQIFLKYKQKVGDLDFQQKFGIQVQKLKTQIAERISDLSRNKTTQNQIIKKTLQKQLQNIQKQQYKIYAVNQLYLQQIQKQLKGQKIQLLQEQQQDQIINKLNNLRASKKRKINKNLIYKKVKQRAIDVGQIKRKAKKRYQKLMRQSGRFNAGLQAGLGDLNNVRKQFSDKQNAPKNYQDAKKLLTDGNFIKQIHQLSTSTWMQWVVHFLSSVKARLFKWIFIDRFIHLIRFVPGGFFIADLIDAYLSRIARGVDNGQSFFQAVFTHPYQWFPYYKAWDWFGWNQATSSVSSFRQWMSQKWHQQGWFWKWFTPSNSSFSIQGGLAKIVTKQSALANQIFKTSKVVQNQIKQHHPQYSQQQIKAKTRQKVQKIYKKRVGTQQQRGIIDSIVTRGNYWISGLPNLGQLNQYQINLRMIKQQQWKANKATPAQKQAYITNNMLQRFNIKLGQYDKIRSQGLIDQVKGQNNRKRIRQQYQKSKYYNDHASVPHKRNITNNQYKQVISNKNKGYDFLDVVKDVGYKLYSKGRTLFSKQDDFNNPKPITLQQHLNDRHQQY